MLFKITAVDINGIPRCFAFGASKKEAEKKCRAELIEYLKRGRKDLKYNDFTFRDDL